jgi:pterin-4a-carbinolamine dehydratase
VGGKNIKKESENFHDDASGEAEQENHHPNLTSRAKI